MTKIVLLHYDLIYLITSKSKKTAAGMYFPEHKTITFLSANFRIQIRLYFKINTHRSVCSCQVLPRNYHYLAKCEKIVKFESSSRKKG